MPSTLQKEPSLDPTPSGARQAASSNDLANDMPGAFHTQRSFDQTTSNAMQPFNSDDLGNDMPGALEPKRSLDPTISDMVEPGNAGYGKNDTSAARENLDPNSTAQNSGSGSIIQHPHTIGHNKAPTNFPESTDQTIDKVHQLKRMFLAYSDTTLT